VAFSNCQVAQPAVLDLNIVLTEQASKIRTVVGEAITVETSLVKGEGSVLADRAQLEEIVMALVQNAREAMAEGGKLVLSTSVRQLDEEAGRQQNVKPGAYVLIGVRDTGCGIDPQLLGHLFEPFVARKQFETGRGLGLPSVYGMVRHGGGFIECESRVGVGTLFTVGFPQSQQLQPGKPLVQKSAGEGSQETILLVEDDESVRTAVRAMLNNAQYRVLEASDGTEALRILERQTAPPQLILTDVMMPRMGGPQLGRHLAAAAPGLKVLYMSGYPDDAVRHTDGKPLAFIAKPFSATDLIAKVRQTLAA
jgi:CheY-like chemotaxis protein